MYFFSYDVFHVSASVPLSLEMFCLQGLRPEVRCFRTEQVHLVAVFVRKLSTGLLEDARLPLDMQTHGPWAPWLPLLYSPATRYFRLLGAPKSQLSRLSMPCGLAAAYPLIRCRLSGRYITAFCHSVLRCVTNRLWLLQPYLRAHFHSHRGKRSGLAEAIDCSEQEEATAKPFSHVHKVSIFPSRLMITVTPRGALQVHRFIPWI